MNKYSVHIFEYGHVNASHTVIAKDDEAAVQEARQFLDGNEVEIWQDRRFVKRLRPGEPNE